MSVALFSAAYESYANEVCANYAGSASAEGFRLLTGGPQPLGAPILPGEPEPDLRVPRRGSLIAPAYRACT